jgi:hypothetical protein
VSRPARLLCWYHYLHSQQPDQHAWLEAELHDHPIRAFQSPEDWLYWRIKVGEGMSEEDGWTWVQRDAMKGEHRPNGGATKLLDQGMFDLQYGYPQGEPAISLGKRSPRHVYRFTPNASGGIVRATRIFSKASMRLMKSLTSDDSIAWFH